MKAARVAARAAFMLLLAVFALSFAGEWHYVLDNLSSFRVHFMYAFCAMAAILGLLRSTAWFSAALVVTAVSAAFPASWYLSGDEPTGVSGGSTFSVLSGNVFLHNSDFDRYVGAIKQTSADVVGLMEVNGAWVDRLRSLEDDYPYRFAVPDEGYRGFAVYSRLPFENAQVLSTDDGVRWGIQVTITVRGKPIRFVLAHPHPPMSPELANIRNRQLESISEHVERIDGPVVVAGDLNVALWSPYYRQLLAKTGLTNSRKGHSAAGTWPPSAMLGVPIDHVLHSPELATAQFNVLADAGSDHLPIVAELSLLEPPVRSARR